MFLFGVFFFNLFSPFTIVCNLRSHLWLAVQNKVVTHGQAALDFICFPHDHQKLFFFIKQSRALSSWATLRNVLSLLFVYELTPEESCAPSLPSDDYFLTQSINVRFRKAEGGWSHFQLRLTKWKHRPLWRGHHCSWLVLLSLLGPIFYTAHVLLPLLWPIFFSKLSIPNCRESPGLYKSF